LADFDNTSILLLHYLVKFISRSLAIYWITSEMINWLATNTSNGYYLSEQKHMCYITSFLLLHVLKMSSSSMNASSGL